MARNLDPLKAISRILRSRLSVLSEVINLCDGRVGFPGEFHSTDDFGYVLIQQNSSDMNHGVGDLEAFMATDEWLIRVCYPSDVITEASQVFDQIMTLMNDVNNYNDWISGQVRMSSSTFMRGYINQEPNAPKIVTHYGGYFRITTELI